MAVKFNKSVQKMIDYVEENLIKSLALGIILEKIY